MLVNRDVKPEDRRILGKSMIYIGDGLTDIPAFSLVDKTLGGYAIGVFDSKRKDKGKTAMYELFAPKHHRMELVVVVVLGDNLGREHDLTLVRHGLSVVALDVAGRRLHDAAVGIGDVDLSVFEVCGIGRLGLAAVMLAAPGGLLGGALGKALSVCPLALGEVLLQRSLGFLEPGKPAVAGRRGRWGARRRAGPFRRRGPLARRPVPLH